MNSSSFSISPPHSCSESTLAEETSECMIVEDATQEFEIGGRTLRARRFRRQFNSKRHPKQLFTPEIKRYLKSWLVRRRNHPYPSRSEKKELAVQTGLTYIQICNWFANWRRKLKNTGKDFDKTTWGSLIKTYNGQVIGNVEQFSLSSEDSIWKEEKEPELPDTPSTLSSIPIKSEEISFHQDIVSQCIQTSLANDTPPKQSREKNGTFVDKTKTILPLPCHTPTPLLLRRWLKSAACFQPKPGTYLPQTDFRIKTSKLYEDILSSMHGKEEVAAAEALTFLARASRKKQK